MNCSHAISGIALGSAEADPATSDESLLKLIAAGDKNAMRLLYVRRNVRVYRFLLRMVRNPAAAEDLLSDVFMHVWQKAGQFDGRSQVTTWLLAIARFRALSAMRRRSFAVLDDEIAASLEDPSDGPEDSMCKRERRAMLQDCFRQLSPAHREVVDLIYYHERSIADVARIVGVPESTVKTRAFHARKRIASFMAARGLDRACL